MRQQRRKPIARRATFRLQGKEVQQGSRQQRCDLAVEDRGVYPLETWIEGIVRRPALDVR
jgi:hypothetical protein